MRSRAADAAARKLRPAFVAASLLLALLLAGFAVALAHSQSQQKRDLERRFEDRARVAATVNEALFDLATSSGKQADVQRFGTKTVNGQLFKQRAAVQQQKSAAIYSSDGRRLARVGKAPARPPAIVRQALRSKSVVYSGIMAGADGRSTIQSAIAFPTRYGTRVDFSEGPAAPLSQFLNSFLSRLPNVSNATSVVIDGSGRIIASPGTKATPGAKVQDTKLLAALGHRTSGSYDGNRYFASAAIHSTPWRIVLSASKQDLYQAVKTTWSWVIFAAFLLMSILGITLLWRVLIANAELQRADISRSHALEINDNVVQRLVLAKYALDRGATETSQQKLAETLRETQQLVTSLLEEREIEPGSLRRGAAAETTGRPDPAARSVEDVK